MRSAVYVFWPVKDKNSDLCCTVHLPSVVKAIWIKIRTRNHRGIREGQKSTERGMQEMDQVKSKKKV
jgi:hypothetical protein